MLSFDPASNEAENVAVRHYKSKRERGDFTDFLRFQRN